MPSSNIALAASPRRSSRRASSTRAAAWLVAGATLLGIVPEASAAPVVPAGTDFKIWYYKTDEDGDRKSYFSAQDLAGYINRARCECGQEISTRVLLSPAQGGSYNTTTRVQTYIGSRCDQAVGVPQMQFKPCVRAVAGFPNAYTKAVNFSFAPIWLTGGIAPGSEMDIGDAVPSGTCSKGQGDAGIWICIEDGQYTDCQANEFQVTGTQNQNSAMSTSTGSMSAGIHYDFEPPQNLPDPTTFSTDTGDGTVLINWTLLTTGDIAGYRVLCADEDGNPLPGKGLDPPPLSQVNVGKLYFTKDNLCPDGPFGSDVPSDDSTTGGGGSGGSDTGGSSGSGDTGGTSGGSDGTGAGTSVGLVDDVLDDIDGIAHASSDSGTSTSATSSDATDSGGDSTETGLIGTEIPSDGILSMKWEYVCSGHIGGTSHEAKVTGLENGKKYQFAIVAYDVAGNPIVASGDLPLTATPRETTDFWEQCELDGDICGEGGFCNCSLDPRPGSDALWLLAGFGVLRLRRRRRGSVR